MDNASKWWNTQTPVTMSAAERRRRSARRCYWFSVVLAIAFFGAFVGMLKECH